MRKKRKGPQPDNPGPRPGRFFEVTQAAGLLEFLLERLEGESRTKIKSLLARQLVQVDGETVAQFDHPLEAGQWVSIGPGAAPREALFPGLKIVFEDAWLIVIDKPAGLLSIATETEKEKTAYRVISRHVKQSSALNRIFIVHRLDREASGLMMFAKDHKTKETLQSDWRNIVFERTYAALVEGKVERAEGTIASRIRENRAMTMYSAPDDGEGREAVTHYRVLKKSAAWSLLEVELETGRKNQIRLHMKELGHSIAGDKKYGAQHNPIKRLGLHAHKLGFTHPVTGERLSFTSPIPGNFLGMVN
jgi:23S rRNA pseudouridine1911/1915/1917 synthase